MEITVLLIFSAMLLLCIIFDISILYALAAGLLLFSAYTIRRGYSWKALLDMVLSGIKTIKNILIIFALIGTLTALWRAAGTIPVIVTWASGLIRPSLFLLMTFLLNSGLSFLMGTSFGTAATMGVICMTISGTLGVSPILTGGAVISGAFFGDRCSPVSTSALLAANVTDTDIYQNIKNMLRTSAIPFAIVCAIYLALGISGGNGSAYVDIGALFSSSFVLHPVAILPALAILVLPFFKVKVRTTMIASISIAILLCIFVQKTPIVDLLKLMVVGYKTTDPNIASMINGGGALSMLRVAAIICLSSSYAGIFRETGLLDGIKKGVDGLGKRVAPFTAVVITSIATGMMACNQTLGIMLTSQLCTELITEKDRLALYIENSIVLTSALIPWSIAGAGAIAAAGAPTMCLVASCFLYVVPLWNILVEEIKVKRTRRGI